MKLTRLGKKKWDVLAICNARGDCQVYEYLTSLGPSSRPAIKMLHRLEQDIPEKGPETYNKEKAKYLEDDIWELMQWAQKGGTPRVYYFLDGESTVICSAAELKKGKGKGQQKLIDEAKGKRREYFAAKEAGKIEIEEKPKE